MNNILQFPLLEPVRERAPSSFDQLLKMPFPRLVDLTLGKDKVEAAKAIAAFLMRLPKCNIGWDDLTLVQQNRWMQLVQLGG